MLEQGIAVFHGRFEEQLEQLRPILQAQRGVDLDQNIFFVPLVAALALQEKGLESPVARLHDTHDIGPQRLVALFVGVPHMPEIVLLLEIGVRLPGNQQVNAVHAVIGMSKLCLLAQIGQPPVRQGDGLLYQFVERNRVSHLCQCIPCKFRNVSISVFYGARQRRNRCRRQRRRQRFHRPHPPKTKGAV